MISKVLDKVDGVLTGVSGIALCVMTLWSCVDAIGRYVFNHPLVGTLEITEEIFMILTVFLAMSYTQKMKANVNVDLFIQYFPKKVLAVTDKFGTLFMFLFTLILTKQSFSQGMFCIQAHSTSRGSLRYPMAPVYFLVALGFLVLTVRLLLELFEKKTETEDVK